MEKKISSLSFSPHVRPFFVVSVPEMEQAMALYQWQEAFCRYP
ncbi:MAG: hypothetical protein ACLSD3_11420 [Acutalibacteraceae bacterium]